MKLISNESNNDDVKAKNGDPPMKTRKPTTGQGQGLKASLKVSLLPPTRSHALPHRPHVLVQVDSKVTIMVRTGNQAPREVTIDR
jgi:hypothetical protein